jgi:hypothetical protein
MDTAHFEKLNRIRLESVLLKARTEIPPLVAKVSLFLWQAFVRPSTRRTEFLVVLYFRHCVRCLWTTRADAIAVLTVDKCDRLVERCPARPNVTHRDVLVPDRHATEEDEPVRG